jgi:hypothetical protein
MPVRSIEGECQPPLYRAKITAKADIFASSWERGDQAITSPNAGISNLQLVGFLVQRVD